MDWPLLDGELVQHPQCEVGRSSFLIVDWAEDQVLARGEIDLEEASASRIYCLQASRRFTWQWLGRSTFDERPQCLQEYFTSGSGV